MELKYALVVFACYFMAIGFANGMLFGAWAEDRNHRKRKY